jgi:hypothetical protein
VSIVINFVSFICDYLLLCIPPPILHNQLLRNFMNSALPRLDDDINLIEAHLINDFILRSLFMRMKLIKLGLEYN